MPKHYKDFVPGSDTIPDFFLDQLQEFLSAGSFGIRVVRQSGTTLRLLASSSARAAISIQGQWRYRDTNLDVAAPAGSAGVVPLHAVASANSFSGATDNTNYEFGLKLGSPSGSGTEAISRQIGEIDWSGSEITAVRMTVGHPLPTDALAERAVTWEKQDPDARFTTGDIKASMQTADHGRWILADGRPMLQQGPAAALYALIGHSCGANPGPDGSGNQRFIIPNLIGGFPIGRQSNDPRINTLGKIAGENDVVLSLSQIPWHDHFGVMGGPGYTVWFPNGNDGYLKHNAYQDYVPLSGYTATDTLMGLTREQLSAGGGQSHNNISRSQVVNYFVRL